MNKVIWEHRHISWKWIMIATGKSGVWWQWKIKINKPYKQWFAYIHTPLFRFSKNNSQFDIGLAFGKYFIDIKYHFG